MQIADIDAVLIRFFRRISIPAARLGLFIIFFWFGILKVFNVSPAGPLVHALFEQTLPFLPFMTFYTLFGVFECLIGLLFLVRGFERVVIPMLALHMLSTSMPLLFLPGMTWTAPFIPTLEGQYIIKNLVIVAVAVGIAAQLDPMARNGTRK